MSNSVDQRIVEMQFDNAQFEKGIAETLASLKNLEQSLTLKDGSNGLESLNQGLSEISSNVQNVSSKFDAMGAIAFSALQRATNAVIDLGANLVRGVTIQPLLDGLDEYKLKMDSITTIKTNTMGKSTLEDINKTLEELNVYADKTIYSFSQMTQNIGRFTAAGVDLDVAAESIKGLSNLAAAAGSNAQQTANAMYNMSQAISVGSMKSIDWRSIENAGMGGKMFQEALIETSRVLGTGADAAIEKNGSFRDSLKEDWATVEVLTQTLKNFTYATNEMTEAEVKATTEQLKQIGYSDEQIKKIYEQANAAQEAATKVKTWQQLIDTTREALGSGWAQTWEYIIGDLNEAEELFTGISNGLNKVIDAISGGRNELLKAWHDAGGRDALVQALSAMVTAMEKPVRIIRRGLEKMIDPITGERLAEMTKDFASFVKGIADAFNGNFNIDGNVLGLAFRTIRRLVEADLMVIAGAVKAVVGSIPAIVGGAVSGAVSVISSGILVIRQLIISIRKFGDQFIGPALEAIFTPIAAFFDAVGLSEIPKFFSNLAKAVSGFLQVIQHQDKPLQFFADSLNGMVDSVTGLAGKIGGVLAAAGKGIASFLDGIRLALKDNWTAIEGVFETFGNVFVGPALEGIVSFFGSLSESIMGFINNLASSAEVPEFIRGIAEAISNLASGGSLGTAEEIFGAITEFSRSVFAKGLEMAANAMMKFGEAFGLFMQGAGSVVLGALGAGFEALGRVWESISPFLIAVKDNLVALWGIITDAVANSGLTLEPFAKFFTDIGDALKKFFDSVSEDGFSFDKLLALFSDIKDAAGEAFSDLVSHVQDAVGSISDALGSLDGPLGDLYNWVTKISTPLEQLATNFQTNIGKITGLFGGKGEAGAGGGESGFSEMVGVDAEAVVEEGFTVLGALDNLGKALSNPVGTIKGWLKGGFGDISNFFNEIIAGVDFTKVKDFGKNIAELAAAGGMVYSLYEFGYALEQVGGLFKAIKGIPTAISGVITSLGDVCKAAKQAVKTQAILNIAIAVGILVASLVALSFADLDKVKEALPIVEGLLIEMAVIVALFGKLTSMNGFDIAGVGAFGGAMLSMAVAIGIMALVVTYIASIPEAQLKKAESILLGFGALMAVLTFVMGRIPKEIAGLGSTFIGLAAAFVLMAACIKILGSLPKNEIEQGGAALVALAVGIAMISAIVGTVGKGLAAGATGLLELAGVIAILAAVMKVLGDMDPSALNQGAAALLGLAIGLSVVIAALHFAQPKVMMEGATSLILIATALGILSAALAGLAMVSTISGGPGSLIAAAGALLMLSAGLALIAGVIGNASWTILEGAAVLNAMAIAIGVLVAAIALLSMLDTNSVWMAVAQIGASLLIFAGALAIISGMSAGVSAALPGIIAMSAAVIVLTASLMLLSQVPADKMVVAFVALAAGILVLAAGLGILGAVAQAVAPGALVLESLFWTVSLGVAIFVGAAALFVVSLALFMDALNNLANDAPEKVDLLIEAIRRFGRGLWEAKDDIALGAYALGYAAVTGLTMAIPGIIAAIGEFISQALVALASWIPAINDALMQIAIAAIKSFADALRNHGPELIAAVGDLIIAVGKFIGDQIAAMFGWIGEQVTGFFATLGQWSDESAVAAGQVAQGAVDGSNNVEGNFGQAVMDDVEAAKAELNATEDWQAAGANAIGSVVSGAEAGAQGFNFLELLHLDPESLNMSIADVGVLAGQMGIAIPENLQAMMQTEMANVTPISQIMTESGTLDIEAATALANQAGIQVAQDGWGEGVKTGLATVDVTDLVLGEGAMDIEALTQSFNEAGIAASTGFNDGFTEGLDSIDGTGPVQKAAEALRMESEFKTSGKIDGQAATNGMAEGMKNMSSKVQSAMDSARKKVDSSKGSMESSGKSVGSALISGMVVGVNSQIPSLEAAVARAEALAERMLRAKAKMNSPSKVFAELGSYMMQGLVIGIESMYHNVGNASAGAADMAIKSMATQASYISGLMDDIEDQPVIRPILDLTDYNAGLAQMQGIDTSSPMLSAQAAGRVFGSTAAGSAGSSAGGHNIQIYLNYDASADANQIVMDIASGLETRLAMEGV